MNIKQNKLICFAMALALIMTASSAVANDTTYVDDESVEAPTIAPLNPAFVEYLEQKESDILLAGIQDENHPNLGAIPSPVSIYWPEEYLNNADSIPVVCPGESYFNLADEGRVTSVKDQGQAGSCWAHASLASLESYLIPLDSYCWNFSENNMKNLLSSSYPEGFDRDHNYGGNHLMSIAYLARWTGPVLESDDPYDPYSGVSPTDKTVQKHLQEAIFIPLRTEPLDNGLIKYFIKECGGLYAGFLVNWEHFGSMGDYPCATYYNPYPNTGLGGHTICVVGWDDNFSASNFAVTPPGDGAFICKNSWGTGNGVEGSGYFYISYYDANLAIVGGAGPEMCLFTAEPTGHYEYIYQYDPLGFVEIIRWDNDDWFANLFTAQSEESLRSVGFYTYAPDVAYDVYVYLEPSGSPDNGILVSQKSGTIKLPGYHTIFLNNPVSLIDGQVFSVVVNVQSDGYTIPIECPFMYYSSKASANTGESYVSNDSDVWIDITTLKSDTINYSNANVCLKAYTINNKAPFGRDHKFNGQRDYKWPYGYRRGNS